MPRRISSGARASPSGAETPSSSMSSAVPISQGDGNSTSSPPITDAESHGVTERFADMQLSQDLPLPSIENGATDSSGGLNMSKRATHSRTPSISLSPPPSNNSQPRNTHRQEGADRGSASLRENESVDNHFGMSQVAAAIENIATGSDRSRVLLSPEPPVISSDSSPQQDSRRPSSSRTQVVLHDVTDEELPHDRFHEPAFQSAFSDSKKFLSQLSDVLSGSSLSNETDSTMRRLFEEGRNLAEFQCPSTRTVGFVGDSGVGKSSLLNSLLDVKDLARTSSNGKACTCVPTEYHFHDRNDFAIEVDWFSADDIAAQLTELLQNYRLYYLNKQDYEQHELKDLQDKANVARDTFRAMFRGRLGDEKFLTLSSEAAVIRTLKLWAAEFRSASSIDREEQNSVEACSTLLMQLTSEEDSAQGPVKWPYIRKIKVFLKAHILSKGLVLVDLPGLRDSNSARRNITEKYLIQCDEIFAICSIGRAMTDASVMSIFNLARQADLRNIGIICTKSDDIQAEEARRDWHGERSERIQTYMDAIAKERRDLDEIKEDLNDYTNADFAKGKVEEYYNLNRRQEQAMKRKAAHEFELKEYLINIRNTEIRQNLNNIYHDKVPGNILKVFCVSNIEYWVHRSSSQDVALPHLKLSGILPIRKHCISMVADSQFRIATKYIQDDIPALLGDIELWVQSGAGNVDAEQREAIRKTLRTLEARLNRELVGNSSQISRIARSFKEVFRTRITEIRKIADWTRAAGNASDVWSGWSPASYSAFCRNYGDHCTENMGCHNWNEEAIEQMTRDLSTPWESLKSSIFQDLDDRQIKIQKIMDWAIDNIESELQNSSESAVTLSQAMISRQHLLLADIQQISDEFDADLSTLRTFALSGIRTSLIGQLMEESYHQCNVAGGRGSDKIRKGIIARKLKDEATFESLQRNFKREFGALVDSLQTDIQEVVSTHLAVIKNTLDIVRNENVALESEREPEFRARVERKVREVKEEINRIQSVISSLTTNME